MWHFVRLPQMTCHCSYELRTQNSELRTQKSFIYDQRIHNLIFISQKLSKLVKGDSCYNILHVAVARATLVIRIMVMNMINFYEICYTSGWQINSYNCLNMLWCTKTFRLIILLTDVTIIHSAFIGVFVQEKTFHIIRKTF